MKNIIYCGSFEEAMNCDGDYKIPVMEGSFKSSKIEDLNVGDVVLCKVYWDDGTNKYTIRPTVYLNFPDNIKRFVRLSDYYKDGRSVEILEDKLAFVLKDRKKAGLNKESVLVPWYYRLPERVDIMKRLGKLSKSDFETVVDMTTKCWELKWTDPKYLMGWMKGVDIKESTHPSGNNNNCIVQNLERLEKSLAGNCVDFAAVARNACKERQYYINTIGYTKFILSKTKSRGHVYCVYLNTQLHLGCVFRYIPGDAHVKSFGDITRFKVRGDEDTIFTELCLTEEEFLVANHPSIIKLKQNAYKKKTVYLNDKGRRYWDAYVEMGVVQKEIFNDILYKDEMIIVTTNDDL